MADSTETDCSFGASVESGDSPHIVRIDPLLLAAALVASAAAVFRLVIVAQRVWITPPPLDDAYMFSRYADHLLGGLGMAWNPGGPQTYGCTSLLYAMWIAVLRLCDVNFWRALGLGSWLPAALVIPVVGLACARIETVRAWKHFIVAMGFAAHCIVIQNPFFFHAASGMDTTLATLMIALLLVVVADHRFGGSRVSIVVGAVVAYLCFLARPDTLLIGALTPMILLLRTEQRERRWKNLLTFAAVLGGLLIADTIAKSIVFSNPLPIPFYAKRGGFYEGYIGVIQWNPARYMQVFLAYQAIPLAAICLFATRRSASLLAAAAVPLALTFAFLATVTQIMGYQARFYYPFMPVFVVVAYHALVHRFAAQQPTEPAERANWIRRVGVVAIFIVLIWPIGGLAARRFEQSKRESLADWFALRDQNPPSRAPQLGWGRAAEAVAELVQSLPGDVTWAMSEYGYIGAMAPNVTIADLAGLHDRNTLTDIPIVDHVLAQQPDVIWFPHADYVGMVQALRRSERFRDEYEYWPSAFDFGLAVRIDSPHHDAIRAELRSRWRAVYDFAMPPPITMDRLN